MIRIALIGGGRRARLFSRTHQPEEGVELAAICDPAPAVREQYAAEFPGIATYDDYPHMLSRGPYDTIAVMSPDLMHEEHGVAALRTGAAVYLEKSIAITRDGCRRLLVTASQHGDRLYVGHNMPTTC